MEDDTCWIVSCWNYGHSKFFCEHYEAKDPKTGKVVKDPPRGMRGSEAGCYS